MERVLPFRSLPPARHLRGLGDISSIVSELQQYGSDQILAAYTWLYQTYQSESQDLVAMSQWASLSAGNIQTLSDADKQAYLSALQDQTTVVNNLNGWVSQFQVVLQAMGIQGAPGLSGLGRYHPGLRAWPAMGRRRPGLGVWPVIVAGLVALIAIIAGVGWYEYNKRLSDQAHETTLQMQAKTQQTAIAAGWTPDQVKAMADAQAKQNQQSWASQIPWTGIGITLVAVVAIRAFFD